MAMTTKPTTATKPPADDGEVTNQPGQATTTVAAKPGTSGTPIPVALIGPEAKLAIIQRCDDHIKVETDKIRADAEKALNEAKQKISEAEGKATEALASNPYAKCKARLEDPMTSTGDTVDIPTDVIGEVEPLLTQSLDVFAKQRPKDDEEIKKARDAIKGVNG